MSTSRGWMVVSPITSGSMRPTVARGNDFRQLFAQSLGAGADVAEVRRATGGAGLGSRSLEAAMRTADGVC